LSQLSHTMNMPETQSPTMTRSTNQKMGSTHSGNSSMAVETVEARPAKVLTWPTLRTRRGVMKAEARSPAE
jgi:hypothetical protein